MKPEIEAKFPNVNHNELRAKLKELGAECVQPMRLMKRKAYDFPDLRLEKTKHGWVRVRDEGGKITLGYKQTDAHTLHGTKEVSLTVDSFDAADVLLQAIGLKEKSYQETKRESWHLNGFEIELDEWPWIKPYIEIEGPNRKSLQTLAAQLGLDWKTVRYGGVWSIYKVEYDVVFGALNDIPVITFEEPVPDWLKNCRYSR